MTDYDAVVIGAGHNGLICATYLAKAKHKVLVLEARGVVGGCASTREFVEGYSVSDCAQWLSQFDSGVMADMKLKEMGLSLSAPKATISLQPDADHLIIDGDKVSGAGVDTDDAAAYRNFRQMMQRFAKVLKTLYHGRPPKLVEKNWTDRITLMKLGLGLKLLGKGHMQDLMRLALINIYDVMNEYFNHSAIKSAVAIDAVTGTNMGPRSPNTVYSYLHRVTGEYLSGSGTTQVMGGMGALGDALAASATAAGVEIKLGASVKSITKIEDKVSGIELADGTQISSKIVVSSADPTTTFKTLLGYHQMEAGTAKRVELYRNRSGTAKLHLALNGLPSFEGLSADQLSQRLLVVPPLDDMETALNPMKYRDISEHHLFDISIPSVEDSSLAPAGHHVLTALVHYVPYEPSQGWDEAKPALLARLIDQLSAYSPDLESMIVASELVTPSDFERSHGMTGGNWHHGELSIDQALMMRPFPGSTQYATPVDGLYLCGAGAHPGGGLMGLAGRNAANEIIKRGALS